MVNGNMGLVAFREQNILIGSNHLVVSYLVKDGEKRLDTGTAVKLVDGKIEHLTADTDDAIGVLYQDVETNDEINPKDKSALVIIFGAVKKERIKFKEDHSDCTAALVEKLRKNGVYVLG